MSSVFQSPDFLAALVVMLVGGVVGGVVNYLLNPTPPVSPPDKSAPTPLADKDTPTSSAPVPPYLWRCIGVGIGAAFIVPIFLYLTHSELLSELKLSAKPIAVQTNASESARTNAPASTTPATSSAVSLTATGQTSLSDSVSRATSTTLAAAKPQVANEDVMGAYLVFFGLCVLAAISGFRFIPAMGSRILEMVNQVNAKVDQAQTHVKMNRETLDSQESLLQKLAQVINSDRSAVAAAQNALQPTSLTDAVTTRDALTATADPRAEKLRKRDALIQSQLALPASHADDPQKGRWGGQPESAHYRLRASVTAIDRRQQYFSIRLWVEARMSSQPLTGDVVFFLHDTFNKPQQTVPVVNGQAILELIAWGGFTVGAVTEDGEQLELDLAQLPDAPQKFRAR